MSCDDDPIRDWGFDMRTPDLQVFACDLSEERQQKFYDEQMREMEEWQATRWMRLLDWIESSTTGAGSWPWGMIWLRRGFSFHFASGSGGFAVGFPFPRWLPGFRKPYQVPDRWPHSGEDLHGIVPLYPPGLPHFMRTRRLRKRGLH